MILIFGRWHPLGSTLACLLFGATEALQLRIQALSVNIPYQFLVILPYALRNKWQVRLQCAT
jgi:general nucleoside transport system permease protein